MTHAVGPSPSCPALPWRRRTNLAARSCPAKSTPRNDEGARETFWVVKNGIRMTGMPAFGFTHDDEKIWDIVAFVGKMHGMSSADYAVACGRWGRHRPAPNAFASGVKAAFAALAKPTAKDCGNFCGGSIRLLQGRIA